MNSDSIRTHIESSKVSNSIPGPLWKSVRGCGLAYGVWVSLNVDSGELNLTIYRSANMPEAYAKVLDVVVRPFLIFPE